MGTSLFPESGTPKKPAAAGDLTVPGVPSAAPVVRATTAPQAPQGATTLFPNADAAASDKLTQAMRLGEQTSAPDAGKTLSLSRKTGLPLAVVQRNLKDVDAEAKRREFNPEIFAGGAPITAEWMAEHPLHASVALPDLQQMTGIEAAGTALRLGWQSGRAQATAAEAQYDAIGQKIHPMAQFLLDKNSAAASQKPLGASFMQDVLFGNAQILGQMSGAIPDVTEGGIKGAIGGIFAAAATAMVGASAPFTVPMAAGVGATYGLMKNVFKQEAGSAYEGLSQITGENGETIPENIKRPAALGVGALNAVIETALDVTVLGAPFKAVARKFASDVTADVLTRPTMRAALATFGKSYFRALIAEPTQEVAQEMTNVVAEEVSKMMTDGQFATVMNDPDQREQAITRLIDIAEQTAKGTLLIAGVGPSIEMGTDLVRARKATQRAQQFIQLGERLQAASPAAQESGGATEIATRAMGADASLYLGPQEFTEYFQSQGVDPVAAARTIWGSAAPYTEALQAGHDIEIPSRVYAEKIAPTEANGFFATVLRTAPDAMNEREGKAFLEAASEMHQTRAAEIDAQGVVDAGREALVTKISDQLVATNRYRAADARDMATQMAHFWTALSAKIPNSTPEQLADRFPLTISAGQSPMGLELDARRTRAVAAKAVEEVTAKIEAAQAAGEPVELSDEAEAARFKEEGGYHVAADVERPRTAGGRLKNLTKATDDEIANEYALLTDANAVDAPYITVLDRDDAYVWTGYKPGAQKAMGRILQRGKTLAKLEAEIVRRGMDVGDMYFRGFQNIRNTAPDAFSFDQAARAQTESPEFKAWFGDSKVVDEQGNPLVVYHGTATNFDEFEHGHPSKKDGGWLGRGFYFTNQPDVANSYSSLKSGESPNVMPVFLSLQNPAYMEGLSAKERLMFADLRGDEAALNAATKRLRAKGHDGIIWKPGYKDAPTEFVVFDSEQIKSAIGNRGTFDPSSPNILHQSDIPSIPRTAEELSNATEEKYSMLSEELADGVDFGAGRDEGRNNYEAQDAAYAFVAYLQERGDQLSGNLRARLTPFLEDAGLDEDVESVLKDAVNDLMGRTFEQNKGDEPRGRITFGTGQAFSIDLLEKADLSTFLHESFHFYVEVMGQLAAESPELAADFQKLRDFVGAEGDAPFTREQHETLARAGEAYFMEGKAPSIELRRVFHRFRTWLMMLYRTISGLDVKLTNEVREVFGRMFATDREIEAAEREAELVPIFTDATQAGMTEEQFANYRQSVEDAHIAAVDKVRAKVMRQYLREREAWWKDARAEVRADVAVAINAQQVYIAMDALKRGLMPDGTTLEDHPKLNRAEVVALKGAEFAKRVRYFTQSEGGLSLEQAAEQFGYSSGDEMLQAFVTAPNRQQTIDAETDVQMKAKYGDMVSDGTLAEEAEQAVVNDHQADIIRAEMRALSKLARQVKPFVQQAEKEGDEALTAEQKERAYERRWMDAERKLATAIAVGKKQAEIATLREEARAAKALTAEGRKAFNAGIPSVEFVREVARQRIAMVKIRDVKPMVYWVAMKKAARAAIAAAGKQDFVTALAEKQKELLNQELYRAALAAKDKADSIQEYARTLQTVAKQTRLAKAGDAYLAQVNGLLERFDFRPLSNRASDRRAALAEFVVQQQKLGLPVNIPLEMQNEAFRMPWKEMTVEALSGVYDTLKHIDHLATLKNRLLKSVANRTLDEARTLAASVINENARKTLPRDPETHLPKGRAMRAIQAYVAAHRKLASYLRVMDGFVDGGVLQQMIMRPLNEAAAAHASFNANATQQLAAIFDRHFTKSELLGMYRKEYVPALGASLTKMGRLVMALNWGTEDNRAKLVAGLTISYGREITGNDVAKVLDTLDRRDWMFVQEMWDFIGSYWPEIEALSKRLDGLPPQKVEAASVSTRFGNFAGGYYPISYDKSQSRIKAHDQIAVTADEVRRGDTVKASTKAGARNDRVAGVKSPLRLDFGVIREHLNELGQDLTHTETLIDIGRILTGDEVKSAIRDHYGDVVYQQMVSTIDAIAAGNIPPQNAFDSALNFVRTGTTVAGLGWNLVTSALQPLGLTNSMVRIGLGWTVRGLGEWIGDAAHLENTTTWITEKSEMMRHRTTTQMREVGEIMNAIGFNRGFTASLADAGIDKATLGTMDLEDLKQSYFWFITRMQLVADIPTWLGAYRKALASSDAIDDATAVSMADQAVLDSQSGGDIKDLAGVQRGSGALKMFTNFYSFMNLTFNQHAEALAQADIRKPSSIGRMSVDLLMLSVVPVTMGYFLKRALKGDTGNDGDDWDQIVAALVREELSFLTGMMVGVREISGVIQGFHGYEGPAGARFFAEAGKLLQQIEQGEADQAAWRAANQVAGTLLHYPAGQVQRTAEGLWQLLTHRTSNPAAVLFGPSPTR